MVPVVRGFSLRPGGPVCTVRPGGQRSTGSVADGVRQAYGPAKQPLAAHALWPSTVGRGATAAFGRLKERSRADGALDPLHACSTGGAVADRPRRGPADG